MLRAQPGDFLAEVPQERGRICASFETVARDDMTIEIAQGQNRFFGANVQTEQTITLFVDAQRRRRFAAAGRGFAAAGFDDVTVEVKLPSPVDRAGVAVRVASADRFIGLFATSDYGTYTLARFNNGKLDPDDIIGNTDLTGVSVGDVIGIRAKGSKVEILTNGTVRNSFDDPKLEIEGTGVGMFAVRDESGPEPVDAREFANWDDFTFLAAR